MTSEIKISIPEGCLILRPIHERAIRVRVVRPGQAVPTPESNGVAGSALQKNDAPSLILVTPRVPAFTVDETSTHITVATSCLRAVFDKQSASLSFFDGLGNLLLREVAGSRRIVAGDVRSVPCFAVEQAFISPPGEHIHGLGQFQDGHSDLRGVTRRLVQVNTQIAIPFFVSSQGYGLLWHQYGLTDFNPADTVVPLRQDPEEGPEYTVTATGSTGVFTETCRIRTYRAEIDVPVDGGYSFFLDYGIMTNRHELEIDGQPVIRQENYWLPPAASAGVRLTAGRHRIRVVATKGEPSVTWRLVSDTTVLRSPHAEALDYVVFAGPSAHDIIAALRDLTGAAPLLPRWAYGFWQCRERYETQAQLLENAHEHRRRRLPVDVMVQDWQYWPQEQWAGMQFDAARYPDPAGMVTALRELNLQLVISVWENVSRNSDLGRFYEANDYYVPDSPWLDATNPAAMAAHWNAMDKNLNTLGIAGWWLDATEPENDALAGKTTHLGPGELNRLTYPLHVSRGVYDGQRAATPERRPCILTRSAFSGQQRYNAITWSGDVGSDWDAFRRQIVAGLNYCASGLPYWTTDIGGFFRPSGQYDDPAYRELLARWFQFGAFNPIFRIHGFGSETEVWRYGGHFEACARRMLELRYRLLPYIYSEAWQVTHAGATMMRPLEMDFPRDPASRECPYQFLFGSAFLVAPVTAPGAESIAVSLPREAAWYDFWTGERVPSSCRFEAPAPIDLIPLFVRAGSIIPFGPPIQHTGETADEPLELRIYPGADGEIDLYEDSGDGFGYERGERAIVPVRWDDKKSRLTIGERQGSFVGMKAERMFRLVMVGAGDVADGMGTGQPHRMVKYDGKSNGVRDARFF